VGKIFTGLQKTPITLSTFGENVRFLLNYMAVCERKGDPSALLTLREKGLSHRFFEGGDRAPGWFATFQEKGRRIYVEMFLGHQEGTSLF